jgi:hypothetical protein
VVDLARLISRRSAFIAAVAALSIGLIGNSVLRPLPAQSQAQGFTFALIGDLAYYPQHEPWLENVYAEISSDRALAFVAHVARKRR